MPRESVRLIIYFLILQSKLRDMTTNMTNMIPEPIPSIDWPIEKKTIYINCYIYA
jgi:hypothetical protein